MQKSAHPASLATRMNNLEQRFDELEIPDPAEPDRALVDMLFKLTAYGAEIPGSLNTDWSKNAYFFGNGMSIATSLYGFGQSNEDIYGYVSQVPFYQRVFGNSDKFGRPNAGPSNPGTPSLANAIFGYTGGFDDVFTVNVGSYGSVCDLVFGSASAVDELKNGVPEEKSIYDLVTGIRKEIYDEDGILDKIEAHRLRMNDLEFRVSRLENRVSALE